MFVKWVSDYYPLGHWEAVDTGVQYKATHERFLAGVFGRQIVVEMRNVTGGSGHGEPAITATAPHAFYIDDLKTADIEGVVVSVHKSLMEQLK